MRRIFLLYVLICMKAFSCEPQTEYVKEYIVTSDGIYYVVKNYNREISRKQLSVKKKNKFTVLMGDSRIAYDGEKIYLEGNYTDSKISALRTKKNSIYGADFDTLEVVYMPKFYINNRNPVYKDKNNIYFDYWKKDINNVDIKNFRVVEKFNEEFTRDRGYSYTMSDSLIGIFFKG